MARMTMLRTVVFRLVAALVAGGVAISAAISALELRNAEAISRVNVTQATAVAMRNIQGSLRGVLANGSRDDMRELITALVADSQVLGARLSGTGMTPLELGDLSAAMSGNTARWHLAEHSLARGDEVDVTRPTLVSAPFDVEGKKYLLETLVDGPGARLAVRQRVWNQMKIQWLLLAVMTLLGLLLVRRLVTGPLSQVLRLITAQARPEPFYLLASERRDEFGRLAEAIGGMLTRLQCTTDQLRRREEACQNLYLFAPAAMVSLDAHGKILEANQRAATLLNCPTERGLVGLPLLDFIRPEDRGLLRLTIDRLGLDPASRCELRVVAGGKTINTVVECAGDRDGDGALQSVHVSLLDVSESKELQRRLADQTHLLNLLIDHISAAILLVDSQGRIVAQNQPLSSLLKCQPQSLIGQPYDPAQLWEPLGVLNYDLFVDRLRQIDADHHRPAQERFAARAGVFLFQGVPVHDASGAPVGRLWVVQEITQQEQSQRLLDQQNHQLQALKHLGPQLSNVAGLEALIEKACRHLFEVFGVEALGLAVRRDESGSRSLQVLHRGHNALLLETNRALVKAVERQLMPRVLANDDVALWTDLPPSLPWGKAFSQAGLTSLAAGPLRGSADAQGILWIARRGGERIERHHLYLLEALAPVIAARLEIAQLRERLNSLEMTDPVTSLPNGRHLEVEIQKLMNRPGFPWALVLLKLDHFGKLNERLDHAAADRVLCRIATRLQAGTRKSCLVARLNDPTFALLVPGGAIEPAKALAERLRALIAGEQIELPEGATWRLTASLGVAAFPQDAEPLQVASVRMELAKRAGRDRVVAEGAGSGRLAG